MTAPVVTVTELMRNFGAFIGRVAWGGERFLLKRGKDIVAELRPSDRGRPVEDLIPLAEGLPHLDPEEAGAFARDLANSPNRLAAFEDPWAS